MCYPRGGTGTRTTVAVPNGSVTVQLTALVRPVFLPNVLTCSAISLSPAIRR
jgi:hypothetical protein